MSEIGDLLRKSAQVVTERGHHKGSLIANHGSAVCLVGAINVACHGKVGCPPANDGLFESAELADESL